jgi:hypothetical protein
MQTEEGMAVATVVEESVAPPPSTAAFTAEEERAVEETAVDQAALAPPAETGSGGEDVVMVSVDDGSMPPSPAREHDVTTSVAPESSAAVAAAPMEGLTDASSSQYVDSPGIGIIDLDTTELPSNDREILEATTERMFADPSVLDAIASVLPVPCEDEGAGGSVPPAAPEAAEGVVRDLIAGTESVVIEPPLTPAGESTDAPLLQAAKAAVDAPTPLVIGAVEGVIGGAGPSSSQPATATTEEVLVPSQPAAAPQERDALEGTTRAASHQERDALEGTARATSPKIQEARWTRARPHREALEAMRPRPSSMPVPRGQLP